MFKRWVSLLLILATVVGLFPAITIAETAAAEMTASSMTEGEISQETETTRTNTRSTAQIDQSSFLFFDFSASDDYSGSQYGGWEYNCDNRWFALSGDTVTVDTDNSVLTLSRLTATTTNYFYAMTSNSDSTYRYTLSFNPKDAEYLQVRMKITGFDPALSNTRFCLNYYIDGSTAQQTNAAQYYFGEDYTFDGSYITLKLLLTDAFRNATVVNGFKLNFWEMQGTGTVTFDYVYIGPEEALTGQDPLFFDFSSLDDYSGNQYGSWDYNSENRWGATAGTTDTIDIDTATGVLSLTRTDANAYSYFYAQTWNADNGTTRYPLSFNPKNAEYLQVRMKISGFEAATADTTFCLYYYINGTGGATQQGNVAQHSFGEGYTFDGKYITLKMKLADAFRNETAINGIKLNFWNLKGTGTVVFDYVYIGPEEGLLGQEPLYFDFNNSEEARNRYTGDTYGGNKDFDLLSSWEATYISTGVFDTISVDNAQGTMSLTKTANNNLGYFYARNAKHLRYRPEQAEYLQMRLSLSGLTAGNKSYFALNYYLHGSQEQYKDAAIYKFAKGTVFEGEYLTFTIPLTDAFVQSEVISQIKLNFWGLNGTGTVAVDYVYIGSAEGLPNKDYLRFGYVTSEEQAIVAQQNCAITTGVTESTLNFNDAASSNQAIGFLTTIEPNAEVTFKASYSGYYTAGSTAESRAELASYLPWKLERPTSQAAAYEAATGEKVLLATNADFYDVSNPDTYHQPKGYLIMEGNVLQTYASRQQPFFAVLKDGSFAIRDYGAPTADVAEAVSGVWLVKDGVNVTDTYVHSSGYRSNQPMNAIGITADGTVHMFVVDGRQESYSMGMDVNDLSNLFVSLGCVNAINLDGGGSATHASVHEGAQGQSLRLRNSPSDAAGERAIADALLLVSTAGQCQHDYSKNYVINSDGTHTVSCQNCSGTITAGHLYTDGQCACGDIEEQPDYLYFDFTNDDAAHERYNNYAYGYWNFDNPKGDPWIDSYWATASNGSTNYPYQIDNAQGVLIADVGNDGSPLVAPSNAYNGFPWFGESSRSRYPLNFVPKDAQYFQIRFKTENCSPTNGKIPQMKLHYHYKNDGVYERTIDTPMKFTLKNGAYQTFTLAIPTSVSDADVLSTFLIEFINVTSTAGSISIDYIFMGSRAKLPTPLHAVTFVDEGGNVLQSQLVQDGSAADYTGETPAKASDATNHYTFSGWDTDYSSITGETTVTAQFVAVAHTFSYSTNGDSDHTRTCSVCNYVDISEHTAVTDAAVAPTCTETGLTEGKHCSVCGEILVAQNEVAALGHTVVIDNAVAPTCTETGLTEGKHCSVCNEVLVAQTAVSATGHAYDGGQVTTNPTCTTDGVKTYTCATCGDQKTEAIVKTGHSLVYKAPIAPTCTENGMSEYYKCATCEATFIDAECKYPLPEEYFVVAAKGHNYQSVVTAPTCNENGYTTYTCSACDDSYVADETAATGHSHAYSNNGEKHTVTCENCDYSASEDHNYVDGACICGAVEVIEPKYEPKDSLKFTMSISVGAEMTVTYNIMGADVNSYKDFYLEVKKDVAGGEPVTTIYGITADREQMTAKVNPATGEALMYQVTYKGINAKEMGDNFSTTLYAVGEDGTIYYGDTVVDSIKSFLVGKIDAETSIPELKTMAVDMLKYGAAAQVRLGYNTENLVTADLTEEQLSYATQETPEAVNNAASTGEGTSVNTNITVTSRVQLNLSCVYTTATDPNAVKCVVTDAEGKVLAEIVATNKGNIMFSAIYENVGAKQMRDVINATFYEGETAISKTISWSVESYVAQVRAKTNVTEDELNMVNAMLIYGDAVAAYMEAK